MFMRALVGQIGLTILALLMVSIPIGMATGQWWIVSITGLTAAIMVSALAIPVVRWILVPSDALRAAILRLAGGVPERLTARSVPSDVRRMVEIVNEIGVIHQTQRFFIGDVAHQLRAEIHLLTVRMERLGGYVSTSGIPTYSRTMADVERLSGTLTEHLERALLIDASPVVEVDVRSVVIERMDAWSDVAARQSLTIDAELEGSPMILARRGTLEQLLDILIDNAVKYSPSSGSITVGAQADERFITIQVLDEGPGMSDEELKRATERGWRADHSPQAGRGLGLSIACMIAVTNGGRISIAPRSTRQGLDVRCVFPRPPKR